MISVTHTRLYRAWSKGLLLAALLPWLVACSTVRLTYGQGPMLTYWWMDSYVDFSRDQVSPAKAALENWFDWHRTTQLTQYASLLASITAQAKGQVSASQVCDRMQQIEQSLLRGFEHAVPAMANIIHRFSPAQLRHLDMRFAKADDSLAADYLDRPKSEWQEKSLARWLENLASFYGELNEQQRAKLVAALKAMPFDPQIWLKERRQRHAHIVATLHELKAKDADTQQIEAALRAFAVMTLQSPRDAYRVYRANLKQAQCELLARLHNEASADQRARAVEKILHYEADMRALEQTSH